MADGSPHPDTTTARVERDAEGLVLRLPPQVRLPEGEVSVSWDGRQLVVERAPPPTLAEVIAEFAARGDIDEDPWSDIEDPPAEPVEL